MSEFADRLRKMAQDTSLEAEVRRALQAKRSVKRAGESEAAVHLSTGTDTATGTDSGDVLSGATGASAGNTAGTVGSTVAATTVGTAAGTATGCPTIIFHRDLPSISKTRRSVGYRPNAWSEERHGVRLEEAVDGETLEVERWGSLFGTRVTVGLSESGSVVVTALASAFVQEGSALADRLAKRCGGERFRVEEVVWFDLETTGLASSPLFLIGAMTWEGGELVVRQFFARHYGEEAAVIASFIRLLEGRRLLVSFNGKSFDLPYVQTRAAANGVPCHIAHHHFDLLHESRSIWKPVVPNCRLQTLERHLFGRTRIGDIPGQEIPDAYHNYVRTSDAVQMVQVLQHNLQDLVTLGELMVNMPPLAGCK